MRKVIISTIVVCLVVTLSSGLVIAAQKSPFEGETITVAVHAVPHATGVYMFRDQFEKKYGIKINVVEMAPEAIYEKEMTEFTAESGAFDVVQFNPAWIADYSRHLEPLEPLAKKYNLDFKLDDVMPIFRELYCSWAGVWYGMPWDGDTHMLYFRKDTFAKSGLLPPKTWEEYLNITKKLSGWDWDGDGQTEYGDASYLKRGRTYWWFLERLPGYGGNYFDEDMNPLINSEAGVKALENLVNTIPYMPPGVLNYAYMEVRTAYTKGDVAMVLQWTDVGKWAEDSKESKIIGKTGYLVVPQGKTMIAGGWDLGIPKYSKHKGAAAYFIHFITSPEISLDVVMGPTSLDPYRVSQYRAPKFRQAWPTAGDYLDAIEANLAQGFPDLLIPGAAEYMDSLDYQLTLAYAQEKSAKAALDAAAAEWEKITKRLGAKEQKEAWLSQLKAMKAMLAK
jgi:multiple sugar transport system substrate-binding protein